MKNVKDMKKNLFFMLFMALHGLHVFPLCNTTQKENLIASCICRGEYVDRL